MNGHVKCITDLTAIQTLWKQFATQGTLWDCWDFRYLGHTHSQKQPRAYVAYTDMQQPIAMIPIAWNQHKQMWEYFGEAMMENNRLFCIPGHEDALNALLEQLPAPLLLEFLHVSNSKKINGLTHVEEDKFITNLSTYHSIDAYLIDRFTAESRGKLKRKIRDIEHLPLHITEGEDLHINQLIQWNIDKFQTRDGSSFLLPGRIALIKKIIEPYSPIQHRTYSYYINEQLSAVTLHLIHQSYWYFYSAGFLPECHKHLSAFFNFHSLSMAVKHGMTHFDAGTGSFGWKERFHMDPVAQYTYIKQ